ncbi:hypothetical protein CTAYLR_004932 [Chrysophaeum taylorii]|uniref:Aldehyde oxidase n=1 Tax=Chrysophaeum taylorii TaxID=2483200 RepID=A0AAD7XQG4_9STRA|nr:hypothetical protein CTAYLR_004932 [Chrysophaeum taylorii]
MVFFVKGVDLLVVGAKVIAVCVSCVVLWKYFSRRIDKLEEENNESSSIENNIKEATEPLSPRSVVVVTVNGVVHRIENPSPRLTLLSWLRDSLKLTGSKIGCGEGGCGACTVIENDAHAINSCLRLVVACDGMSITTIEGLGSKASGYSEEQIALADGNGSQCGFCSPGWSVAMRGLRNEGEVTAERIERDLDGNICRCTGYRPIVESFKNAFADVELAAEPCRSVATGKPCGGLCGVVDKVRGLSYVAPTTLKELYGLVDGLSYEPVELVGGATATIGVSKYYGDCLGPPWEGGLLTSGARLVATKSVPELCEISATRDRLVVGAATTISELAKTLESYEGSQKLAVGARHLRRVANHQVRNSATWAGNLVLAARASGFISDVLAAFCVLDATIKASRVVRGRRETARRSAEELVRDIRENRCAGCVILSMSVVLDDDDDDDKRSFAYADKVSARHSNAHAIANCGLAVVLRASGKVATARCVLGGVADKAARALVKSVVGKFLDNSTVQVALREIRAACDSPDSYEADLAVGLAYKGLLGATAPDLPLLRSALLSLAADRPVTSASQHVSGADNIDNAPASVGRVKLAARLQASGEAAYATDVDAVAGELHAHFAIVNSKNLSSGAGALATLDVAKALRVPGCVDVITSANLAARYGSVGTLGDDDDPLLYGIGDDVFVGARVAIAVATDYAAAIQAARAVVVSVAAKEAASYGRLVDPATALAAHFGGAGKDAASRTCRGVRGKWRKIGLPRPGHLEVRDSRVCVEHVGRRREKSRDAVEVRGTLRTAQTKHFHMETHAARAVPLEDAVLEVYSSSQDNALAQTTIAGVLAYPEHKIVVKCRRAGGGFGGKLTLHLAAASAVSVVAEKHGVACRLHAERRDDMNSTGGREPSTCAYAATIDPTTLELQTYAVDFELTAGVATSDATGSGSMAVAWSDNVYLAAHHIARTSAIQTRAPRNTSMRSPGVLQSHATHELAMVHLAHALKKPIHEVQEASFYAVGDATPYGNVLGENGFNYTVPKLWANAKPRYLLRRDAVDAFNTANKYKKRGVYLMPTKFTIGLSDWKIPAFVVIYSDGTVDVTTGGAEIGQGLYTKVAACAAKTLGCDIDLVRVCATATDKVPNSTCTGGSGTSESACNAAILACQTLADRLATYVEESTTWTDAVSAALGDGVELAATGYNNLNTGQEFDYATYGVGLAEVEVDVITGEVGVVEMSLHLDQGTSLNSEIDLGQIEGGCMMALGFFFTEVNVVDPKTGAQSAQGTWEYKPPMISDIPLNLNVTMLPNTPNACDVSVLRSKASGEPPMQCAAAMFFAAREAVSAAREALAGNTDFFSLPIPATPEAIRTACLLADDNLVVHI